MRITIKLFATFREGRFIETARDYPAGTRIAVIIDELQLPTAQIGMIMCNGRHAEPEQLLKDGDILALFPQVGGG